MTYRGLPAVESQPGRASSASARRMYFNVDTHSYRVTPIKAAPDNGFPWWTLSLLALAFPAAVVVVARKRSHHAIPRSKPEIQALPRSASPG